MTVKPAPTVTRRAHAQRLIARAPKGLAAFLSVGVAGLALHTGVFTVLFHMGVDKRVAWLIALAVATTLTWTLNRKLTFEATGRKRSIEVARYAPGDDRRPGRQLHGLSAERPHRAVGCLLRCA